MHTIRSRLKNPPWILRKNLLQKIFTQARFFFNRLGFSLLGHDGTKRELASSSKNKGNIKATNLKPFFQKVRKALWGRAQP